jgi:hypothetical protein
MNIMRHWWVRLPLLFLVMLAAGIVLKEVVAPGIVRRRLISAVHESCGTCELSLGRVDISLRPLALSADRVRFTGGTPNATVVRAEAERVYVPFSLSPWFKGRLRAGRIEIERPAVLVTEGNLRPSASTETGKARPLDLEVEGVEVKNGSFTYVHEQLGRTGRLSVSAINAAVGPVGSSGRLRDAAVEAGADGLLERSGQFHLQVSAKLFGKAPHADVSLRIAGQELSELNPFFIPNDGIRLKGVLIDGRSTVAIRGARLTSTAYVRYRGLGVHIKKTSERGTFSAFLQSLMASVTMGKQNAAAGNYDRRGAAELERKPKETVISFVLRGMKEAAIEVTSHGSGSKGRQ